MPAKSVAKEADDILLAGEMIRLGARLQVLQAETDISHDRLARLYREIRGCSPPKGMLPFSVDWFMTWLPNIHSSLFYNVYQFFNTQSPSRGIRATIDAYRLYLEHVKLGGTPTGPEADASAVALGTLGNAELEAPLSFTRAWMLVRFFDSGMLQLSACHSCSGHFVTHAHDPKQGFVCAICRPPPRAGKTRAAARRQAEKSAPDHTPVRETIPATGSVIQAMAQRTTDVELNR